MESVNQMADEKLIKIRRIKYKYIQLSYFNHLIGAERF